MIHFVEVLTSTSQNTEVTTSTNLVIEVTPSIRSICRSYNFDKINYRSYFKYKMENLGLIKVIDYHLLSHVDE